MDKSEAREFANFLVYEMVGKNKDEFHPICICKEWMVAVSIARLFATHDPDYDAYSITGINDVGNLFTGGGWRTTYKRDKETERVKVYELS